VNTLFKPKESSQSGYEFVSIDELVLVDHLLRLIDKLNYKMEGGRVLFTVSTARSYPNALD
jgi:hypothetical protein